MDGFSLERRAPDERLRPGLNCLPFLDLDAANAEEENSAATKMTA
jgi:hypothetical protein